MSIPENFIQELTERSDIVDVVSSYVGLTKRSGSNIFGLCPFHSEKTPSFSVSPDKQIYYCFGCGKGGSVINFIMDIENLSYPDAIHFLARRAGMQVPEDKPDESRGRRERMLSLNREAARFFHERLIAPGVNAGNQYADKRGISPAMAKVFGLGFAPDSWDSLINAMTEKGYSAKELVDAGLAKRSSKGSGIYDTFRNRLVFPVIDVRGNVIGFSGRILGDGEPKYLNSPETLVFSKSRNLFALNLAKKSKSGYIILTEGNIDVVSLHQAGFDSAVASLGTSLTPEQARLLSRYTQQIIIAFDSDDAGKNATSRAITIFEKLDMKVRVLTIPGAKDPDEFIKSRGAAAFSNLLERCENQLEYRLQAIRGKYTLASDEDKIGFLKETAALIAQFGGSVEREVYSMRAADIAGISKEAFEAEVERMRKKRQSQAQKKQEQQHMQPAKGVQPAAKSLRYENVRSASAEEGVIRILYMEPSLLKVTAGLASEDFTSPLLGRIFVELRQRVEDGGQISIASLSSAFRQDEISHLTGILQKPEDLSKGAKALCDYIEIIKNEKERHRQSPDLRAVAEKYREKKGYGG